MRRTYQNFFRPTVLLLLFLSIVVPAAAVVPGSAPVFRNTTSPTENYVPGEILVKFKPQVSMQARLNTVSALGHQPGPEIGDRGWVKVAHGAGQTVEAAMAAYRADPNVEYVQPNYIYKLSAIPSDPNYGQLWGLKNTGQTISNSSYVANNPGVAGNDMDIELAWDRITDCSSVIVAVIDSGINYTHQDLAANMWDGSAAGFPNHGYDFVDNDNDPMPSDAIGHGTHVAATIGAVGNNSIGVTGVCWKARLMALRVGDSIGPTTARVVQGVDFAVARGVKVINMSLGGPNFDQAFSDAITSARNAGVLVVVAAGNDGTNNDSGSAVYPCNFAHDNLVCVAALDQAYALANFSNYGSTSVDVGAPGTNVFSAWPGVTITDDFTSGWTMTGGWVGVACDVGAGLIRMLVNPSNWCTGGPYANSANDVAYKTFDLSSYFAAKVSFLTSLNVEANLDFGGLAISSTGGNPFPIGLIGEATGSSVFSTALDLGGCRTAACSIGFRLRSDSSITARGMAIIRFAIDTAQTGSAVYETEDGTSMASPHVAGLAALILAYNPGYTYADTINSIKNGGDSVASLAGFTTTGKAVNAMGSLSYINPPSGVSATVLP